MTYRTTPDRAIAGDLRTAGGALGLTARLSRRRVQIAPPATAVLQVGTPLEMFIFVHYLSRGVDPMRGVCQPGTLAPAGGSGREP